MKEFNRERKYKNEWVNTTLYNWGVLKTKKCITCGKKLTNLHLKRCNNCHQQHLKTEYKKYQQSGKGKEIISKAEAKQRGLKWIKIIDNPFDKSVKIAWHHINDTYVIAIPIELHHTYTNNVNKHRFMLCSIIKQIYAPINKFQQGEGKVYKEEVK